MTITTNRAGLLPQRSKNLDFSVEYYTTSAGAWTAGWFNRDVKDYISPATPLMIPELRQSSCQFWNLEVSYNLTPKVKLACVGRNLFGERPVYSQMGIIRNTQQDTGIAWMFAARLGL